MADGLKFESPVVGRYTAAPDRVASGRSAPGRSAPDRGAPDRGAPADALVFADVSDTVKWLVRAGADGPVAGRLGAGFGSSRLAAGGALVLGSRPGEWIVLGTAGEVAEVIGGLDDPDPEDLVTALDWTHGRAMFRVTGHDAPRMLEKVCSLDWSDPMTPDGAVASASVVKVTCDIARNDTAGVRSYLILCDRSFGQYLFDALIDAGREFDLGIVSPAR